MEAALSALNAALEHLERGEQHGPVHGVYLVLQCLRNLGTAAHAVPGALSSPPLAALFLRFDVSALVLPFLYSPRATERAAAAEALFQLMRFRLLASVHASFAAALTPLANYVACFSLSEPFNKTVRTHDSRFSVDDPTSLFVFTRLTFLLSLLVLADDRASVLSPAANNTGEGAETGAGAAGAGAHADTALSPDVPVAAARAEVSTATAATSPVVQPRFTVILPTSVSAPVPISVSVPAAVLVLPEPARGTPPGGSNDGFYGGFYGGSTGRASRPLLQLSHPHSLRATTVAAPQLTLTVPPQLYLTIATSPAVGTCGLTLGAGGGQTLSRSFLVASTAAASLSVTPPSPRFTTAAAPHAAATSATSTGFASADTRGGIDGGSFLLAPPAAAAAHALAPAREPISASVVPAVPAASDVFAATCAAAVTATEAELSVSEFVPEMEPALARTPVPMRPLGRAPAQAASAFGATGTAMTAPGAGAGGDAGAEERAALGLLLRGVLPRTPVPEDQQQEQELTPQQQERRRLERQQERRQAAEGVAASAAAARQRQRQRRSAVFVGRPAVRPGHDPLWPCFELTSLVATATARTHEHTHAHKPAPPPSPPHLPPLLARSALAFSAKLVACVRMRTDPGAGAAAATDADAVRWALRLFFPSSTDTATGSAADSAAEAAPAAVAAVTRQTAATVARSAAAALACLRLLYALTASADSLAAAAAAAAAGSPPGPRTRLPADAAAAAAAGAAADDSEGRAAATRAALVAAAPELTRLALKPARLDLYARLDFDSSRERRTRGRFVAALLSVLAAAFAPRLSCAAVRCFERPALAPAIALVVRLLQGSVAPLAVTLPSCPEDEEEKGDAVGGSAPTAAAATAGAALYVPQPPPTPPPLLRPALLLLGSLLGRSGDGAPALAAVVLAATATANAGCLSAGDPSARGPSMLEQSILALLPVCEAGVTEAAAAAASPPFASSDVDSDSISSETDISDPGIVPPGSWAEVALLAYWCAGNLAHSLSPRGVARVARALRRRGGPAVLALALPAADAAAAGAGARPCPCPLTRAVALGYVRAAVMCLRWRPLEREPEPEPGATGANANEYDGDGGAGDASNDRSDVAGVREAQAEMVKLAAKFVGREGDLSQVPPGATHGAGALLVSELVLLCRAVVRQANLRAAAEQ